MVCKSPRVTVAWEIEKQAKRDKFPDPSSYKPKYSHVDPQLLGCFKFTDQRNGDLEECGRIGREQGPYLTKKYEMVDPKLRYPRIYKPIPVKKPEKVDLSPCRYNMDDSYKASQLPKPKFYINRLPFDRFIDKAIKSKQWCPLPGKYDQEKGKLGTNSFVTKGFSKGWK